MKYKYRGYIMIKLVSKIFIALLFFSFLSTALPLSKEKIDQVSSPLATSLIASLVLGTGAAVYALWHSFAYTDGFAHKHELILSRWREESLWPLRHTWWSAIDMKNDTKNVAQSLSKDLKAGTLHDKRGTVLTTKEELLRAIGQELDALREIKTALFLNSAYEYLASWFGSISHASQQKIAGQSVDRLMER